MSRPDVNRHADPSGQGQSPLDRLAAAVVRNGRLAWLVALIAIALLTGAVLGTAQVWHEVRARDVMHLRVERARLALEANTRDGTLLGALGMLGLMEPAIKEDAAGKGEPNEPVLMELLIGAAKAYGADGVYVIGQNGVIRSSWDADRSLTGVDVRFRPYAQAALAGTPAVYAAIGTTTGERTLYFAAPVRATKSATGPVVGAVTARARADFLDTVLAEFEEPALLVSPQGVVFATNRHNWLYRLVLPVTAERLRNIRATRQFGTRFDTVDPLPLPIPFEADSARLDETRYLVARSPLQWVDPGGKWSLVLLDRASNAMPLALRIEMGVVTIWLALMFTLLLFKVLKSRHRQRLATAQLQAFAREQEDSAARQTRLAALSLRLQQATDQAALATHFLTACREDLGAQHGLVYGAAHGPDAADDRFELLASHACATPPAPTLLARDGLLGQCAADRAERIVADPDPAVWKIASGLGAAPAAALALMPVLLNDDLLGLCEVAFLAPPAPADLAQLREMIALLAVNLEIRRRNHG